MDLNRTFQLIGLIAAGLGICSSGAFAETPPAGSVSYYKQILPLFQAQCQGCHQPAKAKGGYVMTSFERLLASGDSGEKPLVAGKPDDSHLLKLITPVNGEAEMPRGKAPLAEHEISLVRRWIAEGMVDDTPPNARQRYDMDNPPVYTLPPVVASIDFSPDGSLLAVAGFHEVLLHKADGSGLVARLVGLSERIQSVRFSPDGKWLAVAGGQPARMGEVQVWDVEKRQLAVSVPVTYDTVYGVSWSPDGKTIAFGCADNTVRAIDAKTGKQVLQQGSHNDWVLDTVFSIKGDHVISVGRDMTAKLTETATQRFVDNITSITPGALAGGIHSVARHPEREEILIGGSDGIPQIFRIFRQTARKIGDNAALIRKFPPMAGRINSVAYSPDGKRIVAGSSLDASGAVNVYSAEFNPAIPENLAKIFEKTVQQQTAEEKKTIESYFTSEVSLVSQTRVPAAVYAVAFHPDGRSVAAAGQDGLVRLIDAGTGSAIREFAVAPVSKNPQVQSVAWSPAEQGSNVTGQAEKEKLPPGAKVTSLEVQPAAIELSRRNDYAQLILTARLDSGDTVDVTRLAKFQVQSADLARVDAGGLLHPLKNGNGTLRASIGGKTATVPVSIFNLPETYHADFIRDINPILSKAGCNMGTCHGAKDGKNGFKLSLRGYDPLYDVRAFTDDLASRRANIASPDDSLMLLKATGAVPHEGGQRFRHDDKYYRIVRQWIAEGAQLKLDTPKVTGIEVFPKDPVVQRPGSRQQMRVVATYADGAVRDVTSEAFIESGNIDVAAADERGLVTVFRRGEAPVLARYEGAYAATTVTVMGDRSGFVWQEPPAYNRIDELVAAKWKRMKILPSDLASDAEFIRRVHLDLTGLPPTAEDARRFLDDARESRVKRNEVIEKLIGNPDFVDHWANKWADLLQVNRKFLGDEGAKLFRDWIRYEVERNTPYDQFVRQILTASGSNKENPAASYYKILRTPEDTMENTTHLFMATRFNCNKCHDHPFERWTQDQYYETAAFFTQIGFKKDPSGGDKTIGGTAVEGAKPLFEIIEDLAQGEMKHERTGQVTAPEFPFPAAFEAAEKASRRERLAAWMTSPDNRYFAMSYANRIWGYLMGVGLIEPLDDIRAGNPPSNPELLEYLTREFIESDFNVRHLMRLICQSRTYQLSFKANKWNEDDTINFSHATARRLPAEVLLDAVYKVTGSTLKAPGAKPGMRAGQLSDLGADVPGGFLANLGRPPRESSCECERSNEVQLGSVMSLLSGPAIAQAIGDPQNAIAKLAASEPDDRKLIEELFVRILNRPATEQEIKAALENIGIIEKEHAELAASLARLEKELEPVMAEKERQRLEAVEAAKADLAAYEKELAPKLAEMEKKRQEKIAADEKALQEHEKTLPAKLAEVEKTLPVSALWTSWMPLEAKEAKATGGVVLTKQTDRSILASGPTGANNQTEYTVTMETDIPGITGIKLEVIPDESLPKFGPGRAANDGNFVLTEFMLKWAPKAAPAKAANASFNDAKADFSQANYEVKKAIDGKNDAGGNNNGWAVSPQTGQPHTALFKLAKPVGDAKGTVLTFTLSQKFRDGFSIGRFRLWVTTSADPLEFGLPAEVAEIVKTPPAARTQEQAAALLEYYRTIDAELRKKSQALFTSRQPLPIDAGLKARQDTLAKASLPVPLDPRLVQLRQDVAMSAKQAENKRLTGAQDIAWALINNPAFLFNH